MDERTHRLEIERRNLLEESPGLALEPPTFRGRGIRPERSQRRLGRAGVDEQIFVQIATEDAAEFREDWRASVRQRRFSGYDVRT